MFSWIPLYVVRTCLWMGKREERRKKLASTKLSTFDQKSNYLVWVKIFVAGNVTFITFSKKTRCCKNYVFTRILMLKHRLVLKHMLYIFIWVVGWYIYIYIYILRKFHHSNEYLCTKLFKCNQNAKINKISASVNTVSRHSYFIHCRVINNSYLKMYNICIIPSNKTGFFSYEL